MPDEYTPPADAVCADCAAPLTQDNTAHRTLTPPRAAWEQAEPDDTPVRVLVCMDCFIRQPDEEAPNA
jgi:hypothetical protein